MGYMAMLLGRLGLGCFCPQGTIGRLVIGSRRSGPHCRRIRGGPAPLLLLSGSLRVGFWLAMGLLSVGWLAVGHAREGGVSRVGGAVAFFSTYLRLS